MTPLEKRAEELAHKYGVHIVDNFHSLGTYKKADFREGFLQFKDQPEVKALLKTLEYYAGLSIESVNGHTKAHYDDSEQGPKMSFYEGETWLCGDRAKEALKAWGEFVGNK